MRTSRDAYSTFIKQEYIALWLAMILLAAQQHLGVIADMLSILVNLFHLRQIVTSWRADDALEWRLNNCPI